MVFLIKQFKNMVLYYLLFQVELNLSMIT